MKKQVSFVSLTLCAAMLLGSCSQNTKPASNPEALINEIVSEAAAQQTTITEKPKTTTAAETSLPDAGTSGNAAVDLDLTVMNSTMIYSVIYDMMINPDNYYGKTLMVDGFFDTVTDERAGARYFFVVVPDATACCVQGLEFMLDDSKKYPEDYPEVSKDIRVRGTFDSYEELGSTYYYIRTDELTVL